MSLLSGIIDGAKSKIESAVTSHLPLSNLNKATTNLGINKTTLAEGGSDKYAIGNYQYPQDLSVAADQPHWVTFYINVRGKSKIAQNNPDLLATGQPIKIAENRLDPASMDNAIIGTAAVGGAVAALGAGKQIISLAGKTAYARSLGKGSGKVLAGADASAAVLGASAITAGVGAAVGGAAAAMTVKPDTTYRLKDAITLNVSQSPVFHSSANYDVMEFGALGGFAAGGSSYADTLNASQQNQEALLAAARTALKESGKFLTKSAGAMIEATTKQTLNPYREVLFKQINFRQFSFDYRFLPRSQTETDMVQQIIKTFRYHMHPEMSSGGLYYIHPSEFNIQYYFKGKENSYINKISTCVLVDMDVQYGPSEKFSTFGDGAPVEYSMRLVFQELETLTKERVDAGY